MPKTAKELERIILADGWYFVRQKGSHRHYRHPIKQGKVTIPFHGNRDLKTKTVKNIYMLAGLNHKEDKR